MPRAIANEFDPHTVVTILDAAEAAGLDLPYSCCSGVCAACFARVTAGCITHIENHILEDEELAQGQILVCQAVPLSDFVELDYEES